MKRVVIAIALMAGASAQAQSSCRLEKRRPTSAETRVFTRLLAKNVPIKQRLPASAGAKRQRTIHVFDLPKGRHSAVMTYLEQPVKEHLNKQSLALFHFDAKRGWTFAKNIDVQMSACHNYDVCVDSDGFAEIKPVSNPCNF